NRVYTSGDAAFISMVVVALHNGFDAYQTTDPVIVGDVTGDGTLSGQDVSDVARKAVELTQPNIPDLPPGTTLIMPEGPDPLVSIATGYVGNRGETVGVAVEIDDATNLFSVDLTIGYDTDMLGLDASGISVSGGLLDGWSLNVNLMEETGKVRIGVFSAYALTGGSGEIVNLDFEVAENAPAGTTILDVIGDWLNGGGLVMSSTDGDFTVPVGVTIDGTTTGQEGTPVTLSSTVVGEQGTVAYDWNVYKNGSTTPYATSTDSSIEFTPDEDAVYNVTLTVTDGEGNTGTDVHAVLIDNVAPSADANGPYAGYQGSYITLDASGSTDPGNDIVSYLWDLDGDGEYDDASGPVVFFRAVESGIFNVAVKVIDDDGAHGIDSAQVTVSPTIPGDANGSGTVDNDDMKIVAGNWGKSGMTWADGDFNKDGLVNAIDASILAAHFGATISPPETQPIETQPVEPVLPVEPVIADTTPFIGPLPVGGASSARQPIQPADRVREQAMRRTADAFELPEELLVETTCESATAASDAVFADEYGPANEQMGPASRQAAWSNMVARRQSNRRDAEQLGRAELAVDLLMARR
ncbi:MAG: hypothetical protein GX621_10485, partial [Pirellulaceae bacterium]|nr:hypothetical protein [Pirellulaceae bacterium]